jgi:formylglycine-generating enzyme required for sulfatase activity
MVRSRRVHHAPNLPAGCFGLSGCDAQRSSPLEAEENAQALGLQVAERAQLARVPFRAAGPASSVRVLAIEVSSQSGHRASSSARAWPGDRMAWLAPAAALALWSCGGASPIADGGNGGAGGGGGPGAIAGAPGSGAGGASAGSSDAAGSAGAPKPVFHGPPPEKWQGTAPTVTYRTTDECRDEPSPPVWSCPSKPSVCEGECHHPDVVMSCQSGWCFIPRGCFTMGSPECELNHPQYIANPVQVTLTHDFLIQDHELTRAEWTGLGFGDPSGYDPRGAKDCDEADCPVGWISWAGALAYANELSKQHGLTPCFELKNCVGQPGDSDYDCDPLRDAHILESCDGYRMATEAEWEYATRAGTTTSWFTGSNLKHESNCYDEPALNSVAWYCKNSGPETHPVRQKAPNGWGLYDAYGNAGEFLMDIFTSYPKGPLVDPYPVWNPSVPEDSPFDSRVWRGATAGTWPGAMTSSGVRFSSELAYPKSASGPMVGTRLVRRLPLANASPGRR